MWVYAPHCNCEPSGHRCQRGHCGHCDHCGACRVSARCDSVINGVSEGLSCLSVLWANERAPKARARFRTCFASVRFLAQPARPVVFSALFASPRVAPRTAVPETALWRRAFSRCLLPIICGRSLRRLARFWLSFLDRVESRPPWRADQPRRSTHDPCAQARARTPP